MSSKIHSVEEWHDRGLLYANKLLSIGALYKNDVSGFVGWFDSKYDVSGGKLLFDKHTYNYCYRVAKKLMLESEQDHWTAIIGDHGSGKSWLMAQMCSIISPGFDINCVVYDKPDYLPIQKRLSRGDSVSLDEATLVFNNQDFAVKKTKQMLKWAKLVRVDGNHHVLCYGQYREILKALREYRLDAIIYIRSIGDYRIVVGKNLMTIDRLYAEGNAFTWILNNKLDTRFFVDSKNFEVMPSTFDWDAYKRKKQENKEKFRKEIQDGDESESERYLTMGEALRLLPISDRSLANKIDSGEIKGARFGRNRYVEKADLLQYIERNTLGKPASKGITHEDIKNNEGFFDEEA